jgi:(p)ppGpp synthase/HD superfamily hydrolase
MGANYANLFEVVAGDITASDSETRISELCTELETYLEPGQVEEIYSAYLVGAAAHEGQRRVSGEPYISHPVAVARILAEMRMDSKSIIAAILHDVIEDTPTLKENLADQFGDEVAELVDGVSKLAQMEFRNKAEAQAENFRKMMLAMVRDIRVIIIKLADRLHNMRTLDAMRPDKRRRIAFETMDIYAPIANRLGIFKMRHELLDLSIKAAYPMRYAIRQRLKESNINATVKYRQKNIHSIYRKMKEKKLSFKELTDVFGVRIMTESVDDCYRVLGVMHNLYKPLPGKFKCCHRGADSDRRDGPLCRVRDCRTLDLQGGWERCPQHPGTRARMVEKPARDAAEIG